MNLSQSQLYRIILEEYCHEENIDLSEAPEEDIKKLLRRIKGDPEYEPSEDPGSFRRTGTPGRIPSPLSTADTVPIPTDDAPESEYQGFQKDSGPQDDTESVPIRPRPLSQDELIMSIGELIHGREAEDVADIFQMVFSKIPGVEMSTPGDEDYPEEETLYVKGAEGRPAAGFQLEELMVLIKEVMNETDWHNITAGETAPPHSLDAVEPLELIQRIEAAYHELEEAFEELPDEIATQMGQKIISDLQTLMDVTEYPEDYRE
tara:strand:+ start:2534 stop:3319 length:786 start_codon:yes stop_codon:yes gene_type:complete